MPDNDKNKSKNKKPQYVLDTVKDKDVIFNQPNLNKKALITAKLVNSSKFPYISYGDNLEKKDLIKRGTTSYNLNNVNLKNDKNDIPLKEGRFNGAYINKEVLDRVIDTSKRNKQDPYLLLSLIGRESTFDSNAYNNKAITYINKTKNKNNPLLKRTEVKFM